MSGQRTRPAVPADHRSAHPNIPGVPWWGAVLVAVVASAIGFAFDAGSGDGELTAAFSAMYVIGCVAAVLAVRQSSVFTAVIQPPLVLFVAVPGAYFLMHSDSIEGIKDILINCGYPLIERFPLMFFTSAAVLLIGIVRWQLGGSASGASDAREQSGAAGKGGRFSVMVASVLGGRGAAGAGPPNANKQSERRRSGTGKRAPGRDARDGRPSRRSAAPAGRTRRADTEVFGQVDGRGRTPRDGEAPTEERRHARRAPSRDPRRSAQIDERRSPYDRPERPDRDRPPRPSPQRNAFDGYDRYEGYDGHTPAEQFRPRGNGTHHPVSRVRYRGADDAEEQAGYQPRRRAPRDDREFNADRWEYDI